MTCAKNGVSAKTLQRLLGFGSYQTAWAMLHRFRAAMVRHGREQLKGFVEVDETYVGGTEEGLRGRQTEKKSIVAIAVEMLTPKGFGRVRLRTVADVSGASLVPFVRDTVVRGSVVRTDAWKGYNRVPNHGFHHEVANLASCDTPAHVVMPGVHRVAAQLKRWLLGTHQGAVEDDHLQGYLDEFAFRFNRRRSEFRGLLFRRLLEQAVRVGPISYRSIVVKPAAKRKRPKPPSTHRIAPETLANEPAPVYPWRDPHP
jgi:transposase-like protein